MSALTVLPANTAAEASEAASIVNALTIDVEDYFQVSAFTDHVPRSEWETMECRIERNIERILALLAESGAKATFFTLGWIAERYPEMVRQIAQAGHELASHGFGHRRATEQSADEFRADIRLAKAIIEDVGGCEVLGYRAPSFSIDTSNEWAFDALVETGHRYSSSVYPIRHDHYGAPGAPRFAHQIRAELLEIPIATVRLLHSNWPAGGGGYFRLLPYAISRWSIRRINARDRRPAMFYFHPWEIDPEQPRIAGTERRTRFRHYVNLQRMAPRLSWLFRDFRWDRADRVFLSAMR
jgi:polysaccharide deacetylase family protein (PEP-CTERM system associated)